MHLGISLLRSPALSDALSTVVPFTGDDDFFPFISIHGMEDIARRCLEPADVTVVSVPGKNKATGAV